jgi:hypothetical protein
MLGDDYRLLLELDFRSNSKLKYIQVPTGNDSYYTIGRGNNVSYKDNIDDAPELLDDNDFPPVYFNINVFLLEHPILIDGHKI